VYQLNQSKFRSFDTSVLQQNFVLYQSSSDDFQWFIWLHHLSVVEIFDLTSKCVSIIHQETKHDDMFRCLSVSFTSTCRRFDFENSATMQKVRKFDLFCAYLRRQRVFRFSQMLVQFKTFFVDKIWLCQSRVENNFLINRLFVYSLLNVILLDFVHLLFDELIAFRCDSKEI
jgi:hypothetical protein